MEVPSLYIAGNPNSITADDQISWLEDRCKRCNSIFTVRVKKDDIPVALFCCSCNNNYNYPLKKA